MVVGVYQVLNIINSAHGAAVRQICPYAGFDGAVQPLKFGDLLIAFTGNMLNVVTFYKRFKVRVK